MRTSRTCPTCKGIKAAGAIQCGQCRNRKWTKAEEEILAEMIAAGIDRCEIAKVLRRSVVGCQSRATKLGLKKDRDAVLRNRKIGRDEFWNDEKRVAEWKKKVAKQFTHLDRKIRAEELRQRNRNGVTSFAGKHHTPEARDRIRKAMQSRRLTPEHRAKISRARKRYWIRWRIAEGRLPKKVSTGSGRKINVKPKASIYGLPVSMTYPQSKRCECKIGTTIVKLTPVETRLFEILLLRGKGRFTSYDELIDIVWPNPEDEPDDPTGYLKVYIHKLRAKGIAINTHHGYGVGIANV